MKYALECRQRVTKTRPIGVDFPKLQSNTDQYQVLAIVRPPENATATQIADATAWLLQWGRSVFAKLNKPECIAVDVAERVRHIGPDWESAMGSYTIGRIIQAG